jgi:hypothetical protein
METERNADLTVVETIELPPDPGVLAAIGLNHKFESAVADIVDNSIDASAETVLVRFLLRDGLLTSLVIVDDGGGMDGAELTKAMQLGKPKFDSQGALGHFGVGLKSASFSQASLLTVLSRNGGGVAEGRRMQRETNDGGFQCEVLETHGVDRVLETISESTGFRASTVVRWDDLRTFPASTDRRVTNIFLEKMQGRLRHSLGLVFHRILERNRVRILIDFFDTELGEAGFTFEVDPIDPFGYSRSGAPGYPKVLNAKTSDGSVPIECHIWPAGSDSAAFRLDGKNPDSHQGFYLYRNDRLLSAGDWGGVTHEHRRRRLARARIEISGYLEHFIMSAEKSSVQIKPDLVRAIEEAIADDGTTFGDYLETAEETFQQANKRSRKRASVLPPGQGIPPKVKRALSRELDFLESEPPLRIRWGTLPDGDFVEVDRDDRTLWLNSRYREAVLKGSRGGVNDAPLVKALLFLLFEDIFRGTFYGPKDKDNVALWQEVLSAAAGAERSDHLND